MQNIESYTSNTCSSAGGTWGIVPGSNGINANLKVCYFSSGDKGPQCDTGYTFNSATNCTKPAICPTGTTLTNGVCASSIPCPSDATVTDEKCVKIARCPAGSSYRNGVCVSLA
jgi:hypothetical protein